MAILLGKKLFPAFLNAAKCRTLLQKQVFIGLLLCLGSLGALCLTIQAQGERQISKNTTDQKIISAARVNPTTLAMEFSLPLGAYPGRNGNSLPIVLNYSSKVWHMDGAGGDGLPPYHPGWIAPNYAEKSRAGWTHSLSPPELDVSPLNWGFRTNGQAQSADCLSVPGRSSCLPEPSPSPSPSPTPTPTPPTPPNGPGRPGGGWYSCSSPGGWSCGACACSRLGGIEYYSCVFCFRNTNLMPEDEWDTISGNDSFSYNSIPRIYLRLPNGSSQEFRKSDTSILVNSGNRAAVLSGTYYAVDGSNARLEYNDSISVPDILYLPDGSRYIWEVTSTAPWSSHFTQIDANGNKMIYQSNAASNENPASASWSDTAGRIVEPLNLLNSAGEQIYTIKTLNGSPSNYTLVWKNLGDAGVLTNPEPLRHPASFYVCDTQFLQSVEPYLFSGGNICTEEGVFNPVVLHKIILPNNQEYKFTYNVFGEINQIVYPSSAFEKFVYEQINPVSQAFPTTRYAQANRGVVEQRINQGDGTPDIIWRYAAGYTDASSAALSAYDPASNPYKVTITAPDDSKTISYLHAEPRPRPFRLDNVLVGRAYEERRYGAGANGQILSRSLSQWAGDTGGGNYAIRNARLLKNVNIIFEPGSPHAIAKTVTYQYDNYLNVIQTKTYDYAVMTRAEAENNLIDSIPLGTLLNTAEQSYITDPDYTSRQMVSLPSESVLRQGDQNGAIVAKAQTFYDEPNYPVLDAALPSELQNTWQTPANATKRGNVTTTRTYSNIAANQFIETHAQYDKFGNPRKTWDASGDAGRFVETFYDDAGNATCGGQLCPQAFVFPARVKTPAPAPDGQHGSNQQFETKTSYDFHTGLPLSVTDINGQITTSEYNDILLRPTKVIPPAGAGQTITEYGDSPGNLFVKVKKQLTENTWDETVTYMDGLGRKTISETKDAQGSIFTETLYDAAGRTWKTSNPYRTGETKQWVETKYDDLGRIKEIISPKIANEATPGVVKSEYSLATVGSELGVVATGINQAGKKGRSITDALGRLIRVDEPNEQNELGSIDNPLQPTYYQYDTLGRLRKVTQGVQSRFFLYDSLGRLLRLKQPEQDTNPDLTLTDPITGNTQWSTAMTYDNNGNILTTIDAKGVTTSYVYDKLNRIIQRSYSIPSTTNPKKITIPTPTVNYKYDGLLSPAPNNPTPALVPFAKGKITEIANGVSATQNTSFDNLGRVISSQQVTDNQVYPFSYKYNLSGALIEEKYPSGRIVKNIYDYTGDFAAVSSRASAVRPLRLYAGNFSYTAHGDVNKLMLGNGKWETYQYNNRNQVTMRGLGASSNDTNLWKVNYEYGGVNAQGVVDVTKNDGNIAKQIITVPGLSQPLVQTYSYDALNRLTEARETNGGTQTWRQTFGYDRYGNRANFTQIVGTTPLSLNNVTHPSVDPVNNRFQAGQGYEYDSSGNLIADAQERRFGFDADNKQREVKDVQGNLVATYAYDGGGKRIKKTLVGTGEVTIFVYNVAGKLIGEYNNLAPQPNPRTSYLTMDSLNTPRIITNETGDVISRRDYLPFGEDLFYALGNTSRTTTDKYGISDRVRQKFTGYQRDDETNLDFAEARYYNGGHGRFTAVDPLLASGKSMNPQTFNRYVYAGNNPTLRVDPNGQDWFIHYDTKVSYRGTSTKVATYYWSSQPLGLFGRTRARNFVVYDGWGQDQGWAALDPYENRVASASSRQEAKAKVEAYKRQAALNFIVGAAEAASITLDLSGALSGTGVERGSEMYRLGSRSSTAAQLILAGGGVAGLSSLIANKFGKVGKSVLNSLCCFVAGTPVHTSKGLKPIEQIKAGDLVLSWNEQTKQFEYKPVVGTVVGTKHNLVKIRIQGERKIITTSTEHPFFVRTFHKARNNLSNGDDDAEGEYLTAADLKVGQEFLRPDGTWTRITEIRRENKPTTVYNFEVADNHNYFVSEQGLLVHNCDVWKFIKATQPVYEGSVLPRSFELATGNGRFWVHGNATEHIAEYIRMRAVNGTPEAVRLATQAQLTSFHAAVEAATTQGITYGQMMNVGGWELIFQPARQSGQLPTITHALYTGR